MTQHNFTQYFPYEQPRNEQTKAINFALETFLKNDKRFVVIEAGTGVGKSAIGLTIARYLNRHLKESEDYLPGSYFLTTQKVLQEQYENDFGLPSGRMCSIYSASNYKCSYHKENDCKTSIQMLRTAKKETSFFKNCTQKCAYRMAKQNFLKSSESITNFPYFIMESTYSGKITPRNVLVVDEAHNTESVLSKFVEISISEYFCKKIIKAQWPQKITPVAFVKWISNVYLPKINAQVLHFESMLEKLGLKAKIKELQTISARYEMVKSHADKISSFLKDYSSDNWVMEKQKTDTGYNKIIYRAIDISKFANQYLFRQGRKVILMSATILDHKAFANSLGISQEDYDFISIPSPFLPQNRPIFQTSIGSMSSKFIDGSLPRIKEAIKAILKQHKNEKGIIHCHTYKIANYIKKSIRSKRLLIHDSANREQVYNEHINSKEPTVLLSPSMTEGIDLKGKLSSFQVICKIPYPYLGDPIVKKRMNKVKGWYALQTAKCIVQSCGRSVRSKDDKAITYILDSDWNRFYYKNKNIFPQDFKNALVK